MPLGFEIPFVNTSMYGIQRETEKKNVKFFKLTRNIHLFIIRKYVKRELVDRQQCACFVAYKFKSVSEENKRTPLLLTNFT